MILAMMLAAVDQQTLGLPDFAAAAYREVSRKTDAFQKPLPDPSLVGRRFKISLPVMKAHTGSLATEGIPAMWLYDADKQVLSLHGWEQSWPDLELMLNDRNFKAGIEGFYARYELVSGRSYTGENAFGARSTIHRYVVNALGVAYPRAFFGDESGLPPPKKSLGHDYQIDLPMPGERARSVTQGIRFVVEGVVSSFANGTNVKCGAFEGGASMTTRLDIATRYCLVAGKFDRVSFQDSVGNVLAEWKS